MALKKSELYSSLCSSCDELRGGMDASQYKGSDIRDVCLRLQRRRITTQVSPAMKDAFQVLRNLAIGEGEERRFLSRLKESDERVIAAALRERNPKLYSHSALAQLLGVSKATAHRWTLKGVKLDG